MCGDCLQFYIEKIGRVVELDDELVKKFLETGEELKQNIFTVRIKTHYGDDYRINNVSDKELSAFCNEALFYEINLRYEYPKIYAWLNRNEDI